MSISACDVILGGSVSAGGATAYNSRHYFNGCLMQAAQRLEKMIRDGSIYIYNWRRCLSQRVVLRYTAEKLN